MKNLQKQNMKCFEIFFNQKLKKQSPSKESTAQKFSFEWSHLRISDHGTAAAKARTT